MNYIASLWRPQEPLIVTTIEAQQKTEDTADSLRHQRLIALQKVEELEEEARLCSKKDQKRALGILKRREIYRKQITQMEAQIGNMEQLNMTVDSASAAKDVADSMRTVSKSMKVLLKELNIDDIQEVQDDLNDQTYELADITRAISEPIGISVAEQEDQDDSLLREIAAWSEEECITQAQTIEETMPSIPVKESITIDSSNNNNNNTGGTAILATE